MGKIYDALEKANKPKGRNKLAMSAENKKAQEFVKGNVVPLSNFGGTHPGQGLDANLIAFHHPQSVEAEIFKALRTNLLFPSDGKMRRCIMVTSAEPCEGKSFVSSNLAVSIAYGVEEHVLLIDADIRKPSIDHYFGLKHADGLSEYLINDSDVSRSFVKTPVEKLSILPAGKTPEKPTEILTSKKMKALLHEVTHRYEDRYIIIDSAPPSLAPETGAIAKYVDGIIVVVKAGKTQSNAVTEVIEKL